MITIASRSDLCIKVTGVPESATAILSDSLTQGGSSIL